MKPPARKRTKPKRNQHPETLPHGRKVSTDHWLQVERRNLLKALRIHKRYTRGGLDDIDYTYLRKHVPTRSVSEIKNVVENLKDSVISLASYKLKRKRWEEKRKRKPIEVWTNMASAIAGTQEGVISAAFSQMLIVSSTEPRTLRNGDPPVFFNPTADRPVGRTVPFRPMPRLPVNVEGPGTSAARPVSVLKTPAPTVGSTKKVPAASQVLRVPNTNIPPPQKPASTTAGATTTSTTTTTSTSQSAVPSCQPGAAQILSVPATSPQPASQTGTPVTGQVAPSSGSAAAEKTPSVGGSLIQTSQQPLEQPPTTTSTTTTTSTSKSTSSGPHTSSGQTSSGASSARPTPRLSTHAAEFHAKFGRSHKYATKDSPRTYGVNCVVDFERIYRYLSAIQKPNEDRYLTPMESAIVLDLLMSLPEELRLLDCKELRKHLIKMYRFLSSTPDLNTAAEVSKEPKEGLSAQKEAPSGRDGSRTDGQQNAADVADSRGKNLQPDGAASQPSEAASQPSGSRNASGQSGDADQLGPCPPLNPFMVPLNLLKRK